MFNFTPAKIRRALFAVLLCAAAPAQAQIGVQIGKTTGTSLSLANAPFAGGAATYSWTPPAEKNDGMLDGYYLHVREKPASPGAWPDDRAHRYSNVLPAGVEVSGIGTEGRWGLELGSSLTLLNLPGATTYQVRIRGVDRETAELGHFSDISEVFVPAAPSGLSVSRSGNTISASWDAVAGATGYKIRWARRGQDWINPNGVAGEDAATSYQITNLVAGQSYNLAVRADTADGPGAWTETVNQSGQTLSTNAALSELVLTDADGAELPRTFDLNSTTRVYTLDPVAPETASIRVKATAATGARASIKISATDYTYIEDTGTRTTRAAAEGFYSLAETEVASGALSPPIPLDDGSTQYHSVITIDVLAEDGSTTLQYTINIGRISNDATLRRLEIFHFNSVGVLQDLEGLGVFTPAFVPGDRTNRKYRAEVPNRVTHARVGVFGTKAEDLRSVRYVSAGLTTKVDTLTQSESGSQLLSLSAGVPLTVEITLTAEDGTSTLDYTVTIVRLGSGSDNNRLQNLAV
ncbi:MAG: cadherin-like beta sandwich domain-containing protein, partial [Alphaproteobacteria bacterium]|nr:cadherin-like beta sandwich domain-containing protein [Alphaproteobacteria bacterium]